MSEPKTPRRYERIKARYRRNKKSRRRILAPLRASKEFKMMIRLFFQPIIKEVVYVISDTYQTTPDHRVITDLIMGADKRHVLDFLVKKPFSMPGQLMYSNERDVIDSKCRPGDMLLVRTDHRTPNRYDIEILKNNDTHFFMLTFREFSAILPLIENLHEKDEDVDDDYKKTFRPRSGDDGT